MTIRRAVASLILLVFAGMHAWGAGAGFDPVVSAVYAAGLVVGAGALLLRAFWARFFALGVAVTGVLGCGVLLLLLDAGYWFFWAQAGAFAALGLLLRGPAMARVYEGQAGWGGGSLREGALSWAVILNFAMLPMLLKALGEAGARLSPVVQGVAGAVLGLTVVALLLLLRRRTAGLLLLGLSGALTLGVAAAAFFGLSAMLQAAAPAGGCGFLFFLHQFQIAQVAMLAAGVVPGVLASLVAVLAFAGPMVRLLRS